MTNKSSKSYHVISANGGWAVRGEGNIRSTSIHSTQAEAVKAAKNIVKNNGGEVRTHGTDGRIISSYTIGRNQFEKISAIEGMYASKSPGRKK